MYNVTLDNVTNTTSMTNITYSGLDHTTNYTVVVTPYNSAGPGTPANITVTTLIPSGQNMCVYNYVHPAGVRLWAYVCSNTIIIMN